MFSIAPSLPFMGRDDCCGPDALSGTVSAERSDLPVTEPSNVFSDGAAYERIMVRWSRQVGREFLDWLAPAAGLEWLDVGCGDGAFTEGLISRAAPAGVQAVAPSEEQPAYARTRTGASHGG